MSVSNWRDEVANRLVVEKSSLNQSYGKVIYWGNQLSLLKLEKKWRGNESQQRLKF